MNGELISIGGARDDFPADVDRLATSPGMHHAVRAFGRSFIDHFENRPLLNLVTSDRGRVLMSWMVLYFDSLYDPDDPHSGLTVNRFKAACAETGLCSPGRASAMLGLMRFAGQIEPVEETRRGQLLRLVPTERLKTAFRERVANALAAMALLMPEGGDGLRHLGNPVFERAFIRTACEEFLAREKPLDFAPAAHIVSESKAGFLITFSLILSTTGESIPLDQPMSASISALSRAFSVSRPQVKDMLRRATASGLLLPVEGEANRYLMTGALRDGVIRMLAAFWILAAIGVRAGEQALSEAATGKPHHAA
jgi:hypothetical protein